jgi:hypothetical protein
MSGEGKCGGFQLVSSDGFDQFAFSIQGYAGIYFRDVLYVTYTRITTYVERTVVSADARTPAMTKSCVNK